jgi:hypothetical protein
MDTLATIARWLVGAQAIVEAKVQDHILKLLKSQKLRSVDGSCLLLTRLLDHDVTAPAILELNFSKQLMLLSR